MTFAVTPIREGFLRKVRISGIDDQGQPVRQLLAEGGEPCRDVLRRARPGEPIILSSYCPFTRPGPYREYGAVFVLAGRQQATGEPLRPTGTVDSYLRQTAPVVLRAYSADEDIVAAKLVEPGVLAVEAAEYFARDDVDFVLLRFAVYGCYALRLDRVGGR
ncbi:DUF1203 domain-containing protein [Microbulbifer magnicolonia]|uniref:DUF1203 domain-containing protein n=1 Tax=Microbulbifer magnicolonia TaxID=3109744 RepID=UPI002B413801|nr:DUF1203 domain-containing protein [Microbulbifer sp. GG15]